MDCVSRWQIVIRGLFSCCPNCGTRGLFESFFKHRSHCLNCAFSLLRAPGFTLGAVVINYGVLVFGFLPLLLWLYLSDIVSGFTAAILAAIVSILGPIFLYRWTWSLWLMCYYFFLPHELINNRTNDIPVSDEE